jgi:uncharacterized membrane protein
MNPDYFRTGVIRPVECYREAWDLIKSEYWMFFAITIVGILIGSIVPLIVIGPMICGIYLCFFKKIEGQHTQFETLFKGFDYFLPGLLLTLIVTIPVVIFMVLVYVPMLLAVFAGQRMSQQELVATFIGIAIADVIFAIVMVCFHTLLIFAFPLIVDRKLSVWQSVKTSAKAVWRNLGGVAGLFGIGFLLAIAGYLALCIGVYFLMPVMFAANVVAYRKVFPKIDAPLQSPPNAPAF